MAKFILSLDGGGIRGAASAHFLHLLEQQLQQKYSKSLRDCVDFYAGTSTGSIIALALATTKMTMAAISELYNVENAKQIFTENQGWFELDGINAPKYEAKGKSKLLQHYFKQAKIGDVAANKHVLAITYDIEKRTPVIIKSNKADYLALLSARAADASSAAPTFFPTKNISFPPQDDENWLIDGGVIANNPTMCALAEVRKIWPQTPVDDISVLSVGTGFMTRKINGPASQKWGGLQWLKQGSIMEVLSDERIVAYQCLTLMGQGKYIRVNAKLMQQQGLPNPPDDAMDDISKSNIDKLRALGEFWFKLYGKAALALLINNYQGPSLDSVNSTTGKPGESR
jgi:predicted acylesterase/phospholipase RssA